MTACIGKGRRLMSMMNINEDMVSLLSSLVLTEQSCNAETSWITRKKGISEVIDFQMSSSMTVRRERCGMAGSVRMEDNHAGKC
jgi:hypothetical protein